MTDKVQKIKDWISKEQDGLMDAQGNFEYPEHEGAYHILCNLDAYIDSMQEEPVSDDLIVATNNYCINVRKGYPRVMDETDRYICNAFKAGAKWQAEQMTAKAIDGKVVAIFPLASEPLYVDAEIYLKYAKDLKEGEKVKVIVIKEG